MRDAMAPALPFALAFFSALALRSASFFAFFDARAEASPLISARAAVAARSRLT
jgi:hypothetical protein